MRKTLLTLGLIFMNFALGALAFYLAGSGLLGLLMSDSGSFWILVACLLGFSAIACLLNLIFLKLLKFPFFRYILIALPSLLAGIVLYFVLYILGL